MGVINPTDSIKMLKGTTTLFDCSNLDQTVCKLEQGLTGSATPLVSSVSKSGNSLTFIGSNFPSKTQYTAQGFFKNVKSAVATSWTATSLTVTFTDGIPYAAATENAIPRCFFTKSARLLATSPTAPIEYWSYSSGVYLSNTITVTSSTALTSSFAGGSSYTITAASLFAALQDSANSVTICGNVCQLDMSQSNSSQAVCTLPALATAFSAKNFEIVKSGQISGTWTGSSQT